ncbi:maleylpyruvate isomerase family mycothiol-dependent enzyme [Cellulosimicrobium cellulans]|uniref:maleylpyruvate isomerase family mycothiol-dependent enzyme n=1 Tax=Cellulosimicrobium cellulans TaxID=1710 RepID=UPI0019643971|nr:maleylpyruvate isomerase family mycothiol-dependent enzyme [Cellulosimicrobium cellulans]MBN0041271.1 maleylpyruvate isomerase family mycothiol-dependent enzyme [Cellulosimicrobium cellulans]
MALTGTSPLALPDVEETRRDARTALDAVTTATRQLDDAGLAGPSALPGWSRSHVLAHVTAIGEAMARQAERAAHGELVEVYDGGAAGREAGIQAGARRTVAEHVEALDALAERLDAAWPGPGSPGWDAPVTYRDGTVADALVAWWREVRIHAVDLDAGLGLDTWPRTVGLHLLDFLGVRLGDDVVVELAGEPTAFVVGPTGLRAAAERGAAPRAGGPAGDHPRLDARETVVVRGRLTDVAAWLAGRTPDVDPVAHAAGETVPLPEIGPWPSPYAPPR